MSQDKKKLFGTDGVRGTPGEYPLTNEILSGICRAAAELILLGRKGVMKHPRIVIGKDTRLSGSHLEELLAKSFVHCGIDVLLAGIITTPGLSFLAKDFKADMGIMISASHNKPSDNGIKFFNASGHKLSPRDEERIESLMAEGDGQKGCSKSNSKRKGLIQRLKSAQARYKNFLLSAASGLNLKGVRVTLDCACGAAAPFARDIFQKLGATVQSINDTPSGEHINTGGAMAAGKLSELVVDTHSDIGIALDGDGDRGILVDEKGRILDGDYIIAIMAKYFKDNGRLIDNTVVGTVMSNFGLHRCIKDLGAKMLVTDVGDKHVLDALIQNKLNVGGEQSGHIIFLDYLPTPDGLLTGLLMLKVMHAMKAPLSELADAMLKFPQVLVNIKVREKKPFEQIQRLRQSWEDSSLRLKEEGRILLRYSGTESLARVMVEGPDKRIVDEIAALLAGHIRDEIGIE